MDFSELTRERYSVRQFSAEKVSPEELAKILEAARAAPTAANKQPQRILVLDSAENLTKLKACTAYHFDAPLALVVCYDKEASWKHPLEKGERWDAGVVDASIIGCHIMLEAHNLGLGSTWVGYFDSAALRANFAIPHNYEPVAIFPIGRPALDARPTSRHFERLALGKTTFFNSFG